MDVVASENGGPFAIKTFAGWAIVGPLHMSNKEHQSINCNRIAAKEIGSQRYFDHHFVVEDKVREIVTPQAVNKMFELDFSERTEAVKGQYYSQEDRAFLKIVTEGIQHAEENHYEIPLPFRSHDVRFPSNKEQVFQRARWLKRKFTRNISFYEDYAKFMSDIIAKGFAEKVPLDRLPVNTGKVWYIPHHGVYHPNKPSKIRVSSIVVQGLEELLLMTSCFRVQT